MDIQITGKHIEVGDSLRQYIEETMDSCIRKYFDCGVESDITLSKRGLFFCTNCSVHLDTGLGLYARAEADDIYISFNQVTEKLEKQLRRYKRRIKTHRRKESSQILNNRMAISHILQGEPVSEELPEEWHPVTIAEHNINIPHLSVSDAIMQMDLNHADFFIFRHIDHDRINIVHKREDNNIGWIDTK